jgi:uncharacterized protein YgbK (DUF1537 family)
MMSDPSNNLLLGFYGDDFTGSTDVMETLACAGVPTVLFLAPPSADALSRYPDIRAVGIAGVSRSLPTAEMDAELRPAFHWLRSCGAPLVHYKICSTFDSSPTVGSIGRAIEIGQELFHSPFVPLLVGAPRLGRYCVFGNLFARSGPEAEPYRLDRHPTMRQHPVTPMDESDLRILLARQTEKKVALFDVRQPNLPWPEVQKRFDKLLSYQPDIVLFDVLTGLQLVPIGKLILQAAADNTPLFAVGSSGLESALAVHWPGTHAMKYGPAIPHPGAVDRIVVVSGSCSPVTDRQIAWALDNGFGEVALLTDLLADPITAPAEEARAHAQAVAILATGRSVIIHTSRGPADPRITHSGNSGPGLGRSLGRILARVLQWTGIERAVIAGGDTCGYAAREMGIEALEMLAPLTPGGPLCRVHANSPLDGRAILFKGGQVGRIELFGDVLRGHAG